MGAWGAASTIFTGQQESITSSKRELLTYQTYNALQNDFRSKYENYIMSPMSALIIGDRPIFFDNGDYSVYMIRDALGSNLTLSMHNMSAMTPDSLAREAGNYSGIGIAFTSWGSDSFPGNRTRISKVVTVDYYNSQTKLNIQNLNRPIVLKLQANTNLGTKKKPVCVWYDPDIYEWSTSVRYNDIKPSYFYRGVLQL